MNDEKILERGGTQEDINKYAEQNGADLSIKDIRKCTACGGEATKQTARGEDNEKSGGLRVNDGYYCKECYKKGLDLENEAMYG